MSIPCEWFCGSVALGFYLRTVCTPVILPLEARVPSPGHEPYLAGAPILVVDPDVESGELAVYPSDLGVKLVLKRHCIPVSAGCLGLQSVGGSTALIASRKATFAEQDLPQLAAAVNVIEGIEGLSAHVGMYAVADRKTEVIAILVVGQIRVHVQLTTHQSMLRDGGGEEPEPKDMDPPPAEVADSSLTCGFRTRSCAFRAERWRFCRLRAPFLSGLWP